MKKLPQMLLLSTISLGILSPLIAKAETTDTTNTTETTTTTTTTESLPASDSNTLGTTEISEPVKNTSETTTGSTETTTTETTNTATPTTADSTESSTGSSAVESSGETVEATVYSDAVTTDSVQLISGINGDGTKENQFQVNSYTELLTVAQEVNKSSYYTNYNNGIVYINATSNIDFAGKDRISFTNSNGIVIDGANLKLANSNTNRVLFYHNIAPGSEKGMFSAAAGVSITFQNINFGSEEYPVQNYFGICYTSSRVNTTQTFQNTSYYANYGGQPFFSTGTNSTINFSESNTFFTANPKSGQYNEEFAEFQGTINFLKDSNVEIVSKGLNEGGTGFLWLYGNSKLNVEDSASVKITSAKQYFIYGNTLDISLKQNSSFIYQYDPYYNGTLLSTTSSNNLNNSDSRLLNVSLDQNSKFSLKTLGQPFTNANVRINSMQNPELVSFENNSTNSTYSSSSVFTGSKNSLQFGNASLNNNGNSNTVLYKYEVSPSGTNSAPSVNPVINEPGKILSSSTTPNVGTITNYRSIVYQPAVTVNGISSTGTSSSDISQLTSNLTGVSSALDNSFTYQSQYYISNSTTVLDDATVTSKYTNANATPNNSSTHDDGSVYKALTTLPATSTTDGDQSTSAVLDQLLSGTYTVYGRLQINDGNGNSYYTPWKNTTAAVDPYTSLIFPNAIDLNNSFTYKPTGNSLGLVFNDKNPLYTIVNNSNQVVYVKPIQMSPQSDNEVSLVSDISTSGDRELKLNLISQTNTPNWNLADLSGSSLQLQPYWDSNASKQKFYFYGEYSGPVITNDKATFSYDLKFNISSNP
ncbi:hypothetical protein [uncultured Enterococcus sp.]|uniref:hypothetical protein n=1 Tax=uncultured Enterococcus sp. TaxID=167972 RepID=UPI0026000BC7|nr:hypothetical protein [uncultured Enterococcus sp.]